MEALDDPASIVASLRRPDWPWQTACHVHERCLSHRRRKRKSDPEWLAQLVALVESLNPSSRPRRRWSWLRSSVTPELVSAHQLYERDNPPAGRSRLASWLARPMRKSPAPRASAPAVVAAYEQTFFRVRHCLTAGDYILFGVIGYDPFGGFREGDLRTLWAYYGYAAGPKLLELVMAVSLGLPLPDWASAKHRAGPMQSCWRSALRSC